LGARFAAALVRFDAERAERGVRRFDPVDFPLDLAIIRQSSAVTLITSLA
jgi:hypothetical protein